MRLNDFSDYLRKREGSFKIPIKCMLVVKLAAH